MYLFTWAASEIFSNGSRGVPGDPKTLNRVPELPNAHDGSSIACAARASRASPLSAILYSFPAGGRMALSELLRSRATARFSACRCASPVKLSGSR